MNEYLSQVNSDWFYLIVAVVLTYVTVMCVVFLVKSYRAGIKIGMDKEILKKAIIPVALMTALCIFVPSMIGQTSILMIPCGALALVIGFILFKKGKL